MVETPLLNRATEFLENISEDFSIDPRKLENDKEYFERIYIQIRNHLGNLKKLKDEMEIRGFDSPYFALGMSRYATPVKKESYRRENVEDQRDVARHKMFFRTDASFKKGTFDRTKSAISAHNIAVGHLEELVSFFCKCGKNTKGKDATKIIESGKHFSCPKCKKSNIDLSINHDGVFRLDILPHLPFGGEFAHEISKFSQSERMAYRRLIEILREKKRGRIKSATVTFKIWDKGQWTKKKQQVEVKKGSKLDYEGYLREKYGRIVIENIRYHHERSVLVSGRYNRQALAIAYTEIMRSRKEDILQFLLEKKVDVKKLREYEDLRRKIEMRISGTNSHRYGMDTRINEERQEIIDEFEETLISRGLKDNEGNLLPDLEKAIEARKNIRVETLIKIPKAIFAWDILKFLLIKPYRERRYASIFPGLQPVPEIEQLQSTLNILEDSELVSAIRMFVDNNINSISKAEKIVFKKFKIEEILQDYLKVTSSRAVGGISLYLYADYPLDKSANIVAAEINELKEVLKIIIRLGRRDVIPPEKLENLKDIRDIKISKKAKLFLELVR